MVLEDKNPLDSYCEDSYPFGNRFCSSSSTDIKAVFVLMAHNSFTAITLKYYNKAMFFLSLAL